MKRFCKAVRIKTKIINDKLYLMDVQLAAKDGMTDIVDRLRANAAYWRSEHSDIAEDLRRAADEIEKLREALEAERAAILGVLDSERDRVPQTGEYYLGYREALRNLGAAIKARDRG
jgi:hypothetical protein